MILAGGAFRLLAWPPETGPDSWFFKFLNVKCPTEETLRELESKLKGCERTARDFDREKMTNDYPDEIGAIEAVDVYQIRDGGEESSENEDVSKVTFLDEPIGGGLTSDLNTKKGKSRKKSKRGSEKRNDVVVNSALSDKYRGLATCKATVGEWDAYVNGYKRGDLCPDDRPSIQDLIFYKDCFQIPPRNCFAPIPPNFEEPLPASKALWVDPSLNNIAWHHYACDSFECLRSRSAGDCRECFNWNIEASRWNWIERRNLPLKDVLALKKDSLRLGLDVAGGSGSFAALLASHNITVVTTGMNSGAPFLETMALRGLLALHLPMKARLPFFDRTFDIIHSQHAVQMLSLEDFEFMIFDWDRVLRPGGIIWLDRFYQPVDKMRAFTDVVALLGYKRYSWKEWSKAGNIVKFTAILEKPLRPKDRH